MKFKVIFLLFNVVLVISFLVIYLMPLFIIGWDYTRIFWAANWYLPVIFFVIIAVLNVYFAFNWRLFNLLEREDWSGLVSFLEEEIYAKNRIRRQYVRILVNGYLVNSNTDGITRLEALVREKRPDMMPSMALAFGIPHLLKNEPAAMEQYFGEFLTKRNTRDRNWVLWDHAFALMLQKRRDEARGELLRVVKASREPVLRLLSLYLLDAFSDGDVEQVLAEGKTSLKKRFTPSLWQKELERAKDNVQVVILAKLVQESTEWLFSFGALGDPKAIH